MEMDAPILLVVHVHQIGAFIISFGGPWNDFIVEEDQLRNGQSKWAR